MMKQFKTIVMFPLFVFATIGCSQEELPGALDDTGKGKVREVEVTLNLGVKSGLQVSGKAAGIPADYVTRSVKDNQVVSPRELTTTDNAQQVNDMRIYVFRSDTKDGNYLYYIPQDLVHKNKGYYDISEQGYFTNKSPYYSGQKGGNESHIVTIKPKLEKGYYKFLAVGRDDKYAAENIAGHLWGYKALGEPALTVGQTDFKDMSLSGSVLGVENPQGNFLRCTEFFTGIIHDDAENEKVLCVDENTNTFQEQITLQRAVAGLMLYVKDIPYKVKQNDGNGNSEFTPEYLRLIATAAAHKTLLKDREMPTVSKIADYNKVGKSNALLALINLSEEYGWSNNGKIFTRSNDGTDWEPNSYMTSTYVMPTTEDYITIMNINDSEAITFYLEYTQINRETGDTHACRQKVKMLQKDGTPDYLFPIKANYIYALGKKGTGVNEPYPLTPEDGGDGNIIITVSPDWQWSGSLEWQ